MMLMPEGAQFWMPVLIGLGTVNVLYGAWSAIGQNDLKYVIGYSSVSHMGYVLMGIATLNPLGLSGAVLQMFSHGVMTALFFAVVGVVYDKTHTRDIYTLDGLAKRMGFTATMFAIAGLASLGLPGLSGFVAELLVFLGLFQTYPLLGVLGIIGAAITAVYILRLLARVFFGPLGERWADQTDASGLERVSTLVLAGFILLVGLFPFPFIRVIETGRVRGARQIRRRGMNNNFLLLIPEFMVTGLAFAILTLDFFIGRDRKHWLGYLAAAGLAVTLVVMLVYQWDTTDSLYDGLISIDGYSLFFRAVFLVMAIVIIMSSVEYVRKNLEYPGEYYAILVFAVVGMMLMSASRELLTAYISLELLSFSLYVLVSFDRYNPKSNEGGTKYILLGAVSSALLLFGISQIFGLTGTTRFDEIGSALNCRPRDQSWGPRWSRSDNRRTRIQGRSCPLPHVGPGRVRRRSDPHNRVPGSCVEGRGVRAGPQVLRRVAAADNRRMADHPGDSGSADDDGGQSRRARADQSEATACILKHRSRWVPANGPCGSGRDRI